MNPHRCFWALWTLIRRARICVPMLVVALFSVACASESTPVKSASDCDDGDYLRGKPGYPFRLPKTSGVLAEDYHPLPSADDVPWLSVNRWQKPVLGQALPIRSPIFSGAAPQCPQNGELMSALEQEKRAREEGETVGRIYGEVLGRIEEGIDFLANGWAHDGQLLKRILGNEEEREALLRSVAKDLDELPDLPVYSEPSMARMAQAGFEKGYREGIDAAHLRAFLVNASVDIYFMVIGGIADALESAGARLLDRALMRIRAMPIFVPGTVNGTGFFMTVGRRVAQGSSRKLLKNLMEDVAKGIRKPPLEGEVPHHIVAHTDPRAERAREILAKFDMKVDDGPNGVFLPGTTKAPNPKGKAVHTKVHTDAYYEAVYKTIRGSTSKQDLINRLQDLALKLEKGGL